MEASSLGEMVTGGDRGQGDPELRTPDGRPLSAPVRLLRGVFARGGILRKPLLYLTPRLIAPRLPELVARYPDGRLFYLPADQGPYAEIFTRGEFAPAESATLRRLLRPGDFAVDVGANIGWFTILMGVCVGPTGRVWAIEPVPPTVSILRRNIDLNELPIDLHELAVGAENGMLPMHVFRDLLHGHASASTLERADYDTFEAKQRTLDGLLQEAEGPPALIKVDVEGSELAALNGATETIASPRPPIWILEVNYETAAAFGYEPNDLLEAFRSQGGYRTFRIAEGGLIPELDPKAAPNGANWVVVPAAHDDRVSAGTATP